MSDSDELWKRNEFRVRIAPEMAELAAFMREQSRLMADRMLYPWKYPRLAPFPDIELFPRLTKAQKRAARAVFGLRSRIWDAATALDDRLAALECRIGPPKHRAARFGGWDD